MVPLIIFCIAFGALSAFFLYRTRKKRTAEKEFVRDIVEENLQCIDRADEESPEDISEEEPDQRFAVSQPQIQDTYLPSLAEGNRILKGKNNKEYKFLFPKKNIGVYSAPGREVIVEKGNAGGGFEVTTPKQNQDRARVSYPYDHSSETALFAVFDGHGEMGGAVAKFAMDEVESRLEAHPSFLSDLSGALRQILQQIDRDIARVEGLDVSTCDVKIRQHVLFGY